MQAHVDWSHTEGPPPLSALENELEPYEEERSRKMEALDLMGELDDSFPYQVHLSLTIMALDLSSTSCVCEECLLTYLSTDGPLQEATLKIHDLFYTPMKSLRLNDSI